MVHFLRNATLVALGMLCLSSGRSLAQGSGQDADLGDFENAPAGDSTVTIQAPKAPYPTSGAVRYFSPTGSNDNDGLTPATAWKTLTQALVDNNTKVPNGATLVFAAGRYPTNEVTLRKALTLQPAAGAKAWLVGSLPITAWQREGTTNVWSAAWTVKLPNVINDAGGKGKQTIIGTCPDGKTSSDHEKCPVRPEDALAGYRDQLFLNDKPLRQVLSRAEMVRNTFFVNETTGRIFVNIGQSPVGQRLDATAYLTGLLVNAAGQTPAQRIVVRGLGFRNYGDESLKSYKGNFQLENCTFAWSSTEGATVSNTLTNVVVKGNTFSYNGRMGLGVGAYHLAAQQPSNLLIEDNVFSYNNHLGFAKYWHAGGMKLVHADDVTIRRNLFESNYGTGMWLDLDVERAKVFNNIARNKNVIGIFYEVSRGGLFAGNVCYGNGVGIKIHGSSGVAVFNNTLLSNNINLEISDNDRLNDHEKTPEAVKTAEKARGILYEAYEIAIRNNVLADGKKANLVVSQYPSSPAAQEPGRMVEPGALNHNLYLRWSDQVIANTPTKEPRYYTVWWNQLGTVSNAGPNLKYATLAAFRSAVNPAGTTGATGFDVNSAEVVKDTPAQLFVNPTANNYELKPCGNGWSAPAAAPLTSTITIAVAKGTTGSSYAPAFTISAADYRAALGLPATATLRVGASQDQCSTPAQQPQTITFTTSFANRQAGQRLVLASTSTGATGIPVTYALVNTPATVATLSGDTLILAGVGSVTVRARKAGNAAYAEATAEATFSVAKGTPSIDFAELTDMDFVPGATRTLAASSSTTAPVVYSVVSGPATVAGNTLTLTGVGTVTVKAHQAATANYLAAEAEQTFVARGVALALNAGGATYSGPDLTYLADAAHASGGTTLDRPERAIAGTTIDRLYQSERYGEFSYALPLEAGTYEVNLKFAELYFEVDGAGKRLFDVLAEGTVRYDNLDVYAAAGGANRALNRTFTQAVTDGTLNLQFRAEAGKNAPQLCGLVVRRVSDGATASREANAPSATAPAMPSNVAALRVYPNPNHGEGTLELRADATQTATVYVHDKQGNLVSLVSVPVQAGATQFRLPGTLSPGVYYLQTRLDGHVHRFTLEVQ